MFTATRRASTRVRRVWLVFCFAGCVGGDADAPTVPPPPNPGTISLTPATATITARQGEALKTVLTIARGGGYAGPVSLTVSGARDGVTVDIAPDTLTGTATSATATITVAATTPPGTYPLVITPSGGRASATAATVTLTVTALPVGFSLTASTPSVPVLHGSSAIVTVNLTRLASFTGAVTLSVAGAPRGVTVTEPGIVAASGRSASFTVAATASATAGPVTLTVQGSGPGVAVVSIPLAVTIQAQASGGTTIRYCAASAPVWVAQQDGAGPWARVEPTSAHTYRISFASGKGGIATMRTLGTDELDIVYLTREELVAYGSGLELERCGSKTVRVPVIGVAPGDPQTAISYGRATAGIRGFTDPTVTVYGAADGPQVLVGSRGGNPGGRPPRLAIRRGVDVPDLGVTAPLNFANTDEAFNADLAVASVGAPSAGSTLSLGSYFVGARAAAYAELSRRDVSAAGTVPYVAAPSSRLEAGELQALVLTDSSDIQIRSTTRYFRAATAQQFGSLPPSIQPAFAQAIATAPYRRARVTVNRVGNVEYDRYIIALLKQPGKQVTILVTVAYLGGLPDQWEAEMPDMSAALDWENAWGLTSAYVEFAMMHVGGTAGLFSPTINDGDRRLMAVRGSSARPIAAMLNSHVVRALAGPGRVGPARVAAP